MLLKRYIYRRFYRNDALLASLTDAAGWIAVGLLCATCIFLALLAGGTIR